jgi:hypothetical protein
MDVAALVGSLSEPASTRRAHALFTRARGRLSPAQRDAIERWGSLRPFDAGLLYELRHGAWDLGAVRKHIATLERARTMTSELAARGAALESLVSFARERPAVVSTIVWQWFGHKFPAFAAHVLYAVRERAGLPDMSRRHTADEPATVDGFADRQVEDVARWFEHVSAPTADTLADAIAATEAQRAAADRVDIAKLSTFMRQSAQFFHVISQRGLDPLGFALSRSGQIVVDPPLEERLALATWARAAKHAICPRGNLVVLRIAIDAPWPFALELIAAELGRGGSGGAGLLLRLRGDVPLAPVRPQPLLLCLPGEPIEELGPRFERWLARAYPAAVDAWRRWS